MRIVSGSGRGRKLRVVPGDGTRPILDRVKTALFDILRPRIEGIKVLDLFAGSGSVGIETLSQGAAHCTFTELGNQAIATIKKNLDDTGFSDRAAVRRIDAFAFLKTTEESFGLIYVAPPQYKRLWVEAMQEIARRPGLLRTPTAESEDDEPSGLAIVQIHPKEYEKLDLGTIRETRQKRYGNTLLVFYELASESDSDPASEDGIENQGDEETAPRGALTDD